MSYIHTTFPDDFSSDEEKSDVSFGKKVAEAISSQWCEGQMDYRRKWISEMRAYSKGEQTTNYKRMIEGARKKNESEIDHKNYKIDYSEKLRILPVFKDILSNSIDESLFVPKAEAIDITAVNDKKNFFKNLEQDFFTKEFSDIISQGINVDITRKDLPKDERELKIRKLEYKPNIEKAQELAVQNVFKHQRFEGIKDKVDEDLIDIGLGVGYHYTDYSEGIKIKYIDPYNYIHSLFEMDDARDARYHGAYCEDTIGQMMKLAGRNFSVEELSQLKTASISGNRENLDTYDHDQDQHRLIEYIDFEYAVHESRIFKKLRKNKSVKLIERTETGYDPTNPNKKVEVPYKVWYRGIYIPTAGIMIKWEKIPNQVEKEVNNPISNYVVYAPKVKRNSERGVIRFDSLIQRAKPIVDDIQRDWYKLQQLKAELRPNTVTISPRALNNVVLNGQKVSPQDVLDLFFGRGILLGDEVDEDGEPIGRAIREENGGLNNSALGFLSQEFSTNYGRLRTLLGVNELRDGTTQPNSKTSVTVQKLLLASSNNATNHIVKASFNMSLRMCEAVSLRLYDVLTTKALKDRYMSIIGSDNVDLLDDIKKLPLHKFAMYFDFKPDNEERLAFESSIINAFNNREITVSQYNTARQIRNTKSANKFLEYAVESNIEKAEKRKLENIQAQSNANTEASLRIEDKKQQTKTIEFDVAKQLKILEADLEDKSERKKAFTKELLAQREHERKLELAEISKSSLIERDTFKEDRKDDRENLRSENQAVLIEKRSDVTKDVNFSNSTESKANFKQELDSIFNKERLLPNE